MPRTASARLVSRLFDDPRIFDSYFRGPGKPEIVSVPKLLLLLGEFEVRLKTLASAPNVILPLFVASLLTYFGEEDGKEREALLSTTTSPAGAGVGRSSAEPQGTDAGTAASPVARGTPASDSGA